MTTFNYHTLDLNFLGIPRNIACFIIPLKSKKWALIDPGPYSCHKTLSTKLTKYGITLSDIERVFITHIHLDHSGGAWALAEAGAQIHVHPIGAPHLINPTKLYESAKRIYGEKMGTLWSKVGPISKEKVITVGNGESLTLSGQNGDIQITAHYTPGHASHHISWQMNDVLFAGDICGVRLNEKVVEIPAPPPEYHIGQWLDSLTRVRILTKSKIKKIAITHFGSYSDLDYFIQAVEVRLHEITAWFRGQVKDSLVEEWKVNTEDYITFLKSYYFSQGMNDDEIVAMFNINPPDMSVIGILRYLKKFENL